MVNNFWGRLFPSRCVLCGRPGLNIDLCGPCAEQLPRIGTRCEHCGLPLPPGATPLCGRCLYDPPPFATCISPLLYQAPISQLLTGFKYGGKFSYGRVLAAQLIDCLRAGPTSAVDCLLPVPLHWRRRWQRGFNQSEIIADELGRALRLPVHPRWLRRRRATPPQQGLTARERARNLRDCFVAARPLHGLRIALIDDVVTTGATAAELTRVLRSAGAAAVQVWCLARTPC
jgi:ComF family protein